MKGEEGDFHLLPCVSVPVAAPRLPTAPLLYAVDDSPDGATRDSACVRKPGGWCWLEASPRGPRVGQLGPLTAWGPGARVGVRRESRLAAVAPFVTGLTGRASRDVLRSQSLPGSRRSARARHCQVSAFQRARSVLGGAAAVAPPEAAASPSAETPRVATVYALALQFKTVLIYAPYFFLKNFRKRENKAASEV